MKEGEKAKTYAKFDTTENTTITPYVEGGESTENN
jgi:hypothetical protein